MKFKKKLIIVIASIIIFGLLILGIYLINSRVKEQSAVYIFSDINNAPEAQTALILGAKVFKQERMSSMLEDRSLTALELYYNGKVKKILISGDHGKKDYDEVNTVKNWLLQKGVLAEDIFLDHAGFDTYDSLFRAKHIFQVESLIIITQNFHLPRAVYLGRNLGIDAYGLIADKHSYRNIQYNEFREKIANIKSFFELNLQLGSKYLGEPIPITGDSKKSWD
ncbi:YdcF family protein [Candidatus Parcubacteria bacterium]|nr:YdcF family protein [Candidatus Parcubacteria bacterium]